jgi:hypothetical protein
MKSISNFQFPISNELALCHCDIEDLLKIENRKLKTAYAWSIAHE